MRLALRLTAASTGLSALGAASIVLGGLCCLPASFLTHIMAPDAAAAALDPDSFAARPGGDCRREES